MTDYTANHFSKVSSLDIDARAEGQRIDNFLLNHFKGLPRSKIYSMLRSGEVRINSKRVKPPYRLKRGDKLRLPPVRLATRRPALTSQQAQRSSWQVPVLYEDSDLMVVNKPSGLAVHGGSGLTYGLIELLRLQREDCHFLELVHRLDRETSGCLVLAKKRNLLTHLHQLFTANEVKKKYLALVDGSWPRQLNKVDVPLANKQVDKNGKPSCTTFQVVQRWPNATLIAATPHSGRTHQIRLHARHVGYPIIGDVLYGSAAANRWARQNGCKRLFLHAQELKFRCREGNDLLRFVAPLPDELKCFMDEMVNETSALSADYL